MGKESTFHILETTALVTDALNHGRMHTAAHVKLTIPNLIIIVTLQDCTLNIQGEQFKIPHLTVQKVQIVLASKDILKSQTILTDRSLASSIFDARKVTDTRQVMTDVIRHKHSPSYGGGWEVVFKSQPHILQPLKYSRPI